MDDAQFHYSIPSAARYVSRMASASFRSLMSSLRSRTTVRIALVSKPLPFASAYTSLMSPAVAAFSSSRRSTRSTNAFSWSFAKRTAFASFTAGAASLVVAVAWAIGDFLCLLELIPDRLYSLGELSIRRTFLTGNLGSPMFCRTGRSKSRVFVLPWLSGHRVGHDAAQPHVLAITALIRRHVQGDGHALDTLALGALDLCRHEVVVRFQAGQAELHLDGVFLDRRRDAVSMEIELVVGHRHAQHD